MFILVISSSFSLVSTVFDDEKSATLKIQNEELLNEGVLSEDFDLEEVEDSPSVHEMSEEERALCSARS